MQNAMVMAAAKYVARCQIAGDQRSSRQLLEEIVEGELAARLAVQVENLWVV